jgi:glyoxylase-like metal-dependent hydrolase (beta-lactamase superfamily II)
MHPTCNWDVDLTDRMSLSIGDIDLEVIHTPGRSPGSVCFSIPALLCLFTGDTLMRGDFGPRVRPQAERLSSIETRLFNLPEGTRVHSATGRDTTVGRERMLLELYPPGRLTAPRLCGEEAIP